MTTTNAFNVAVRLTQARSVLVAFIIIATSAGLLWGLYEGTQSVMRGDITAGHLGVSSTVVVAGVTDIADDSLDEWRLKKNSPHWPSANVHRRYSLAPSAC